MNFNKHPHVYHKKGQSQAIVLINQALSKAHKSIITNEQKANYGIKDN